jgi:hypothetical protein
MDYLLSLQLEGRQLHQTARKTTVLGFVATIKSVIGLYVVMKISGNFPEILPGKVSTVESFPNAIFVQI